MNDKIPTIDRVYKESTVPNNPIVCTHKLPHYIYTYRNIDKLTGLFVAFLADF